MLLLGFNNKYIQMFHVFAPYIHGGTLEWEPQKNDGKRIRKKGNKLQQQQQQSQRK